MTPAMKPRSRSALNNLNVPQLQELARKLDIPGRTRLRKSELVQAIWTACERLEAKSPKATNGGEPKTDPGPAKSPTGSRIGAFPAPPSIESSPVLLSVFPLDPTRLEVHWHLEASEESPLPVQLVIRDVTLIEFDTSRCHWEQQHTLERLEGRLRIDGLEAGRSYWVFLARTPGSGPLESPPRSSVRLASAPVVRTPGLEGSEMRPRFDLAPGFTEIDRESDARSGESKRELPGPVNQSRPTPAETTPSPSPTRSPDPRRDSRREIERIFTGPQGEERPTSAGADAVEGSQLPSSGLSSDSFLRLDATSPSSGELHLRPLVEALPGSGDLTSPAPGRLRIGEGESGEGRIIELHADLVVHGRATPGSTVVIEGRRVPVSSEGTFELRLALQPRPGDPS